MLLTIAKQPCLSTAITVAGCQPTDVACQCAPSGQNAIRDAAVSCLLASCTNPADLIGAQSAGAALCSQFSATNTGSVSITSVTSTSVTTTGGATTGPTTASTTITTTSGTGTAANTSKTTSTPNGAATAAAGVLGAFLAVVAVL